MLLDFGLVKTLEEYNLSHKDGISHKDFVEYVANKSFLRFVLRINYFLDSKEKLFRRIDAAVEDCIERDYIKRDSGKKLLVTARGRDLVRLPLGFFEDFLRSRKRTVVGGVAISVIAWLITHLWPWVSSRIGI